MNSRELRNLMFSPQWTAKLLHHFFCGAQRNSPQGIKTELLYLVLPLLVDDYTRVCVKKANVKSTFSTTFMKNDALDKEEVLKLNNALLRKNDQVVEYKRFTNMGLVLLGNSSEICMGKFTFVKDVVRYQDEPSEIKSYCRAAYYLGVLFAKENYLNIFLKLGITNL